MTNLPRLGLCVVLAIGACSSGSDSPSTETRPRRSPTSAATALPSAHIELSGDTGLAGVATSPSIRCNFPDLEGVAIAVLAQPPDTSVLARLRLLRGRVTVFVSSGSGSDYHERAFQGAGVTSFDAAKGATVRSTLTEVTATAGTTKGSLGAVTVITASIDCGDQTAGTSTIAITGDTAEGRVERAVLDPVRVECTESPDGTEVVATGLVRVGSGRALVKVALMSDGAVTVEQALPVGSRQYRASGSSTITPNGASVRADVVEQETATPPHTLHVEGDLTCGRHAAG
jgi:hypothetical protein